MGSNPPLFHLLFLIDHLLPELRPCWCFAKSAAPGNFVDVPQWQRPMVSSKLSLKQALSNWDCQFGPAITGWRSEKLLVLADVLRATIAPIPQVYCTPSLRLWRSATKVDCPATQPPFFFLSEPVAFRRVYGLEAYSRTSGDSIHHRQSVSDTRVTPYQLSHEGDSETTIDVVNPT